MDESSQQTSNLAWYGCMKSAWDSPQRKFDAKLSKGKSLSSILTIVSKTERVSDSPCQGRATKVNSQVYDLMPSRPPEFRSVPMSVREATNLETTLRGAMESYNFQLWIVTALFRFLGDSGCCPMDDPLLDQFQRSFSRGAENLAAALASSTALGSAKRRESFLTRRRLNAHESRGRHDTSPVPHHKTHGTHHLLQAVSGRGRNPPIPPGNTGVFGGRSLPPCPT